MQADPFPDNGTLLVRGREGCSRCRAVDFPPSCPPHSLPVSSSRRGPGTEKQQLGRRLGVLFVCSLDERPGRGGDGRVSELLVQAGSSTVHVGFPGIHCTDMVGWAGHRRPVSLSRGVCAVRARWADSPRGTETQAKQLLQADGQERQASTHCLGTASPKRPAPAPLAFLRLRVAVLLGHGVPASSPKNRQWQNCFQT